MTYLEILSAAAAIGAAVLGLGYIFSQFVRGKNNRTREEIEVENSLTTYLKNQVEGFQGIIKAQDEKIVQLGKDFSALKAVCEEKDKTITKYLEILQNRNPEMDAFIHKISAAADAQAEFNKHARASDTLQMAIFGEIKNFMVNLNDNMKEMGKDFKIEATVTH